MSAVLMLSGSCVDKVKFPDDRVFSDIHALFPSPFVSSASVDDVASEICS